jgi:hypothetical protein
MNRIFIAYESPSQSEQEVEYVNDEKHEAEAAVVDGGVGEGAVELSIADEASRVGSGTVGYGLGRDYRGCGGGDDHAPARGVAGDIGGGAYGLFGDVPGACGVFGGVGTERVLGEARRVSGIV